MSRDVCKARGVRKALSLLLSQQHLQLSWEQKKIFGPRNILLFQEKVFRQADFQSFVKSRLERICFYTESCGG